MRPFALAVTLAVMPLACGRSKHGPAGVGADEVSTTSSSTQPALIIDTRGRAVVGWYSSVVGGNNVTHARRLEGGVWTDLPGLGDPAEYNGPVDLASGAGDEVIAAWCAGKVPSVLRVAAWRGSRWELLAGVDSGTGRSLLPRVVAAPDGRVFVAWWFVPSAGVGAELRVRQWTGTAWVSLPSPVVGPAGDIDRGAPDLALDAQGAPVMAWSAAGPAGSSVFVARWDGAAWTAFGPSLTGRGIGPTSGESTHPRLALGRTGPVVAWVHAEAGRRSVHVGRWTGTTWEELAGSASGRSLSHGRYATSVAIAATGSGEPLVAWGDGDDDGQDIFLRAWSGSAWIAAPGFGSDRLSAPGTFSVLPALAWAGGRTCVAWALHNGDRVVAHCSPR